MSSEDFFAGPFRYEAPPIPEGKEGTMPDPLLVQLLPFLESLGDVHPTVAIVGIIGATMYIATISGLALILGMAALIKGPEHKVVVVNGKF